MIKLIFDLHIHTSFSDGILSPEQVVDIAKSKKIDGIAITDHDTVDGLKSSIEYSKKISGIIVIPGIEFSCIHDNDEVHILGYFIDYKSKDIIEATIELKENRINRGIEMINKINSLGMKLTLEEVKELSNNDFVGRPHIARALAKRGYFSDEKKAFDELLSRGKSAYVERKSLGIEEAINLIHKVNGIAILAHPGLLKNKETINYCIKNKIDGLEAIHSKHSKEDVTMLLEIGRKNKLIITGGSDCHGKKINGDYLLGKYYINIDDIPSMKGRL